MSNQGAVNFRTAGQCTPGDVAYELFPEHKANVAVARRGNREWRSGWSLLEILLALVVIAVLFSLLIPMFGRMVESSRTSGCLGNLRSINRALFLYAADHGGDLLPAAQGPYGYWYNLLDQYLGGTDAGVGHAERPHWQHCPSKKEEKVDAQIVGYGWNFTGFGNNTWGVEGTDGWQHTQMSFANLADVHDPSDTVIIGDSKDVGVAPEKIWEHRYLYANPGFWYNHARRHNGGGHYLFLDGHIEWMTPEMLRPRLPKLFHRDKND